MSDDTDTGTDTSTAVRNARRRANRSLVRQLRPWLLLLGAIIAFSIYRQGSAQAAVPVAASESACAAFAAPVLPAGTGGMRFDPDAELDTSNFEDWRG